MNTSPLAIDASVALKWVVAESHTEKAQALLADTLQMGQRLIAPPHFYGEVENALYQRVRTTDPSKHIPLADADHALALILGYPIRILIPSGLYPRSLHYAHGHALPSVYDSFYVVLAHLVGAELWTADQRLMAALGPHAPWVRFIGAYQI